MSNATSPTPEWFDRAWNHPFETHTIPVEGADIRVLTWGDRGKPGLLMVHGGLAHAEWWRFLAPLFADDYFIAALDLSGHGDSGHRDNYGGFWPKEVMAVHRDIGFADRPVLVGHSMGGLMTAYCAATFPEAWSGALICDSPITRFPEGTPDPDSPSAGPRIRHYPDLETAVERFRLLPAQPCANDFIVDAIARASLKRSEGGWTWKFDPHVFETSDRRSVKPFLSQIACPWWLLRGSDSTLVGNEVRVDLNELGLNFVPLVAIPEAHHHVVLDQPLAFTAVLRAFLASIGHV
ncbi:Alpha/beta hydrolase [Sulfidibacter corallicola]|uniref:Alpha/beta hydrolase n=1 Tax=Sulfidibacter corallicola TaxID=2818388 RepID=A0A8A4TTU4_SULCO|nr:alpha/beta hydrolase [Sulfidibacter corallicola]QTD52511.1 alpha/beta hydrolase [Sulfidibacter corallicola]